MTKAFRIASSESTISGNVQVLWPFRFRLSATGKPVKKPVSVDVNAVECHGLLRLHVTERLSLLACTVKLK